MSPALLARSARVAAPLRANLAGSRTMATSTVTVYVNRSVAERDAHALAQSAAARVAEHVVPHGMTLSEMLSRVNPATPGWSCVVRAADGNSAVWSAEHGLRLLPTAADAPITAETKVECHYLMELPATWLHARLSQNPALTPTQLENEFHRIAVGGSA